MAEEERLPDWMVGAGLDTDMTGDPRLDAGKNVRFWMPKGTERKVIFLTDGDRAKVLWEHQVRLAGKWQNWATCLEPLRCRCGLCDWSNAKGEFGRSKVACFTVIDCAEFKGKDGKVRSNLKKLLCAKKDTAEIVKRKWQSRREDGQSLRGAMFKVFRTNSEKSPAVGDDFEFVKMVDLATLPDAAELPYADLLAPNPEVVKRIVARLEAERGLGAAPAETSAGATSDTSVEY